MGFDYVHGYSQREVGRLLDQAGTLSELLHCDTRFPAGSRVLEAGCGVGAQTVFLARNSPGAKFTSVDVSADSLARARERVRAAGLENVAFELADLKSLSFPAESFDHVFVCFVLEHLADPLEALASLRLCLRPGGTVTVIEGDHGTALFHPEDQLAKRAIQCLVDLQAEAGGDANLGRRLRPLLHQAGFDRVAVSPRLVYADAGRPEWVEGFTRNTFIAMIDAVAGEVLAREMMTPAEWRSGVEALRRTAGPDGVFCYTFFKAVAVR
jgi:SAM-dependent methyltransferase